MSKHLSAWTFVLPVLLLLYHFMGITGALFIGYSVISAWTEPWRPFERWAPWLSGFLTLVGVVITACSVYFPSVGLRRAYRMSRYFISPMVVACAFVAMYYLIANRELPQPLISGFALLAISGALLRSIPWPADPGEEGISNQDTRPVKLGHLGAKPDSTRARMPTRAGRRECMDASGSAPRGCRAGPHTSALWPGSFHC